MRILESDLKRMQQREEEQKREADEERKRRKAEISQGEIGSQVSQRSKQLSENERRLSLLRHSLYGWAFEDLVGH